MNQTLILLLSIFMLSTAPAWVKSIELPPLFGLAARLLLATSILSLISIKKIQKEITKKTLFSISCVGFVLFIHFWTWFAGLKEVTVSLCATIFAVNPIFSALLSAIILKEEFKKRFIISLTLAIGGVAYLSLGPGASYSSNGIKLIVLSSFLYALYMVLSKYMRRGLSNGAFTSILNASALAWALLFILLTVGFTNLRDVISIYQAGLNAKTVISLIGVVIGPSILGHTLMIYSLPHFNINFVGILKLLSPVSASVIGVIIFNDQFDNKLLVALILVLSGILVALPWERGFKSYRNSLN